MAYKTPAVVSAYSSDRTDRTRKKFTLDQDFPQGIQPNTMSKLYHKYKQTSNYLKE